MSYFQNLKKKTLDAVFQDFALRAVSTEVFLRVFRESVIGYSRGLQRIPPEALKEP